MKTRNRLVLFLTVFISVLASLLATRAANIPAPDDQEEPAVVANGNGYFVVWADKRSYSATEYDIYGARVSNTGEVLDPGGIPICTDPGRQTSPRIAFDGQQYLVVWEDDRESSPDYQLYQIYGARVTTGGLVTDPNGFKITTNRLTRLGPAVVSNGRGFFVAWEDWQRTDGAIADVYGSPVSSDGVVANPDGIPLVLGAGWQVQPRLAFANGEYLMTYRDSWITGPDIWGIRLSTAGQPLSSVFRISNSNDEAGGRYGLASNGRDYFVVWGDNRGSPSGFGYPKIYGTLVRSNGVVASPSGIPIATNSLYQERPRIASDGNEFLVVWQASNDPHEEFTDIYGAKLTGDGTVGAPARIEVNRSPGVQFNPDVAFNAGHYLVAWQDGRSSPNNTYPLSAYDIYGTLVTGTGDVSATDGFLISGAQSNTAPTVTIISPRDGDTFGAPANIFLIAGVRDPDGMAGDATVEFFAGFDSLGIGKLTDPGPPHDALFRLDWTSVPAGEYTLTAKATDDRGAQATSPPVKIIVRSGKPVVNVEASKADAYELGDSKSRALLFRVTRTGPIDFALPVSYRVGGTAQNGVDFEELSGRVVIPIGAKEAAILTYARFDEISEGDETVEVTVERPSCDEIVPPPRECYEVGEHGAAYGLIHDAPATPPVVSLELVDPDATETLITQNNIDWAEFRVLRSGDLTRELFVLLDTQQGSARLGEDYWLDGVQDGSTVRFPPGQSFVRVRLYPIDDDFYEGDETVFFHLLAPPAGTPLPDQYEIDFAHSSVAMVIHDNDPATTRLEITSPRNGQQFQPGDIIELSARIIGPGSTNSWSVGFFDGDQRIGTTRPGSPIWWADAAGGQHTINARAADSQGTVLTATVTIQVGPGAALPVVRIDADPWRTGEPCPTCIVAPSVLTIERTAPTNTALTVFLEIDGTATAGDDYQALPSSVEIPAGQRSVRLALFARDDQLAEGPEVARVRVLPQPPPLLPATYFVNVYAKEALVVIFDDEPEAPQARLDIIAPTNGSHLEFPSTIQLSALGVYTQNEVDGPVEFYDGDQFIARAPVNATARPAIPGLPSVHTAYWTNPPVGQHVLTARTRLSLDQSITSPPVNVTVDSPMFPIVRLETVPLQNPQAPEFCPANADCAYPSFVVRRSGPTNDDLRVYLSYSGTATAGVDYPSLPDSLVIPAGRDAAFLMLVPKDDTLVEGPETVIARFTPVPGPGYIQDPNHASATITIIDNERPLDTVVSIGVDDPVASESSILTVIDPARFRISRTGDLSRDDMVFFSIHGSATAGKDYQEVSSPIRIPEGKSFVTFDILPVFDQLQEGMETVLIRLEPSPLMGPLPTYDIDPAGRDAMAIILDNREDQRPHLQIVVPIDGEKFPTTTSIEIVAAAYHSTRDISRVDFYAGSAKIGESLVVDLDPLSGGLIVHRFTWKNPPAGVHVLTAQGFDDLQGSLLTSTPVRITVGVEPPKPVVSIEATQRIAEESSQPFRRLNLVGEFTISRTGPANQPLYVFAHYSGTAISGLDYPVLPELVTIPAGAISTVIRVEAINDRLAEGIETLVATLSPCGRGTDPRSGITCFDGYALDPARESATVFIRDDGITEAGLEITKPTEGAGFRAGGTIPIEATAIDLEGYFNRIEFWDGEQRIGVSEIVFIRPPDPGTPIHHSFEWKGALPGSHRLTARATRVDGTTLQSRAVNITVRDEPPTDRELHVVGAYSGTAPGGGLSQNNEQGDAAVVINRPGQRVTLVLSAYEPVVWHLTIGSATVVERVILGGYYRQTVQGVGVDVETIDATFANSPDNFLYLGYSPDCPQFYRALRGIHALTALEISSFHGSYQAPYPTPIVIDSVQNEPRLNSSYPQPTPLSELPNLDFQLSFYQRGAAAPVFSRRYTLAGPQNGSMLLPATRVIPDSSGRYYYGLESHQPFRVDLQTGTDQNFQPDAALPELSWPSGLAYDSQRDRMLLVSFGGEGYLYAYSSAAARWSLLRSMNNADVDNLEYHAAGDALYALSLAFGECSSPSVEQFTPDGQFLSEFPLSLQGYDSSFGSHKSSLVSVGEYLVLLLEPAYPGDNEHQESRIYLIDPRTGQSWLTYRNGGILANRPAVVTILTPSDGASFNAGGNIVLGANVTDADGDIDRLKLEFFANGRKIGDAVGPNTSPMSWIFRWTNVAGGEYTLTAKATDMLGATVSSLPVHITVGAIANQPPRVAMTRPTAGAELPPNTAVEIIAEAIDPDGFVGKVEFFADGRKIGERNIVLVQPPEPGQSRTFTFLWNYSTPGPHVLIARATDDGGAIGWSAPVAIRVTWPEQLPIVSVVARDAFAVEPGPLGGFNPAMFRIRRFGPTNEQLVVNYSLHGTAQNGIDYEMLSGHAIIPAGRRSVSVAVRPLPDDLAEGIETVILQLEGPADGQPAEYQLGFRRRAVAAIGDIPLAAAAAQCIPLHDGLFHLCFAVGTAQNFRVEGSSDLRNWETLFVTLPADGAVHFVDDTMNFPQRFYRLTPEPVAENDD